MNDCNQCKSCYPNEAEQKILSEQTGTHKVHVCQLHGVQIFHHKRGKNHHPVLNPHALCNGDDFERRES